MKTLRIALVGLIMVSVPAATRVAAGDDGRDRDQNIRATLIGYSEVPAVSTEASGRFRGTIAADGLSIDYTETFSGLQGTVTQSHIHVAQKSVNGGIVIWLCQTGTNPAPSAVAAFTPVCPQSGTVTGHVTAASVLQANTPPTQQILAGELADVIAAIRAGVAYANVHTTLSPRGEIRGQIKASDDKD